MLQLSYKFEGTKRKEYGTVISRQFNAQSSRTSDSATKYFQRWCISVDVRYSKLRLMALNDLGLLVRKFDTCVLWTLRQVRGANY